MVSYPTDSSKIHLIDIKKKKFVLDVNSEIFFEIDDLVYAMLGKMCDVTDEKQLVEALSTEYPKEEIIANLSELKGLIDQNLLFSEDQFTGFKSDSNLPLGAICLNIAHDCNLRCAYCFANKDGYNQDRQLMSTETAERSIDFLIENSKDQKDLEVSFFGGEPLLNIPVMYHTVKYGEEQAAKHGKSIRFHITTNGTLLTPNMIRYLIEKNFSMILSLDGPKEVQDRMRCFLDGKGSYDIVVKNLKSVLLEENAFRGFTVRSTFTSRNLDIENLMMHLADIGCSNMSVEPAFIDIEDLDISEDEMDKLLHHYDILADQYLNEMINGRYFSFFHLKQMMDICHRRTPRLTQCGASVGLVGIGADGRIYPCQNFVGKAEYVMGDVYTGITNTSIKATFSNAHVRNKSKCMSCWARYICGGGCHSHAIQYNNDILIPHDLECEMMKRRIELGIYLYTTLKDKNPSMYEYLYKIPYEIPAT
jgi:uncharacterized protein